MHWRCNVASLFSALAHPIASLGLCRFLLSRASLPTTYKDAADGLEERWEVMKVLGWVAVSGDRCKGEGELGGEVFGKSGQRGEKEAGAAVVEDTYNAMLDPRRSVAPRFTGDTSARRRRRIIASPAFSARRRARCTTSGRLIAHTDRPW